MPQFIISYCKDLFARAMSSKSDQVTELLAKCSNLEFQVSILRDKLEEDQTSVIEQQRRNAEIDSELKLKEIQIERLQRKAIQDQEILEENCKSLEERLRERNDDVKALKEV